MPLMLILPIPIGNDLYDIPFVYVHFLIFLGLLSNICAMK